MTAHWLNNLTREQKRIVLHGCSGKSITPLEALLVIAGPGTGKTMTLAAFAAHRIDRGVDPSRILVVAFSRSAAHEMEARVLKMIGRTHRSSGFPRCGTFHAIGLQFVRRYASSVDLEPTVAVQDKADSARMMESALDRVRLGSEDRLLNVDTCLQIYSLQANTLKSLKAILSGKYREYEAFRKQLLKAFRAYNDAKRANNVIDFDDILTFWYRLLRHKKIGWLIRNQFDYVLVDEYQDTTPLQNRILHSLRPGGPGLVVVGDNNQCIYGFRGATPAHILAYAKRAKVLRLTQCFRSTQPILNASNAVISQSQNWNDKLVWSKVKSGTKPKATVVLNERTQARHVIERIVDAQGKGIHLSEQAVLARTAAETEGLEAELKLRDIPYRKIGGADLFGKRSVIAVLAVLKWTENPKDTLSGHRALQIVPGIDPSVASRIVRSLRGIIDRNHLLAMCPYGVRREHWLGFVDLLGNLSKLRWDHQIEAIHQCCRNHKFADTLGPLRVRELIMRGAMFSNRAEFLEAVSLRDVEAETSIAAQDCLTISTLHSAKGKEWMAVYVLNAVEGHIPARRASESDDVEEERRIFFVGMTRAKRYLELIVPKRLRSVGNSSISLARTRFVPKRSLRLFKVNS
jgi:ATP-dependent DNA helicase UvrD/PcrA